MAHNIKRPQEIIKIQQPHTDNQEQTKATVSEMYGYLEDTKRKMSQLHFIEEEKNSLISYLLLGTWPS